MKKGMLFSLIVCLLPLFLGCSGSSQETLWDAKISAISKMVPSQTTVCGNYQYFEKTWIEYDNGWKVEHFLRFYCDKEVSYGQLHSKSGFYTYLTVISFFVNQVENERLPFWISVIYFGDNYDYEITSEFAVLTLTWDKYFWLFSASTPISINTVPISWNNTINASVLADIAVDLFDELDIYIYDWMGFYLFATPKISLFRRIWNWL